VQTWTKVLCAIQPSLLAITAVFQIATDIVSAPSALVRPVLLAAVVGVALFAAFLAVTRNWALAAIFGSGFVMFTFRMTIPGLALLIVGLWWVLVIAVRRAAGRRPPSPRLPNLIARIVGVFSIVLVITSAAVVSQRYLAPLPAVHAPEFAVAGSGGPNIYVLLLDGYPRSDTLRDTFGIDNSGFERDLTDRGFTISPEARANYNKTWLTLASMLNGEYIDRLIDLEAAPPGGFQQARWLHSLINEASVTNAFRERGYTISTIPTAFTSTAIESADEYLSDGRLTELEVRLIALSPWSTVFRDPVLDWLADAQADAVVAALDTVESVAEMQDGRPRLLLAHIHSPHTPFVLHPEGTDAPPKSACLPSCGYWNATIDELDIDFPTFQSGLRPQIEELNRLVIEAVDEVIDADPDGIVVLMSDHGIRYSLDDIPEHYRIFVAARVPGESRVFAADESPVNILRVLLATIGEDTERLSYERWEVNWWRYLDIQQASDR
jgi:hypothetical protein